jgi:2-polyprenyl-3-methyl-5-hydroxy-6-metoxy-1,4-benzoquinol methylase
VETSFFDRYPRFRETSRTDTFGLRLEHRYQALIERQARLLKGARVLDLASHDGRWSFAALENGAASVTGIEGRPELIARAEESLRAYGVEESRYRFLQGDCLERVRALEPDQFDVIFCFGFLYHTLQHYDLLRALTALRSRALIIDSRLVKSDAAAIMLGFDDTSLEGASIPQQTGEAHALVGFLTTRALELMLDHLGWSFEYLDWSAVSDWSGVEDYRDRKRFTLIARRS